MDESHHFKRVLFVNLSQLNFEAGVHSWDGSFPHHGRH
jgi:hypothetical protein